MSNTIKTHKQLDSLDHTLLANSQINNSRSKQQYSFTKANRWKSTDQQDSVDHFYELPSTLNHRASSLGYGNKIQLGKVIDQVPGSTSYTLPSYLLEKAGISMGKGRADVKANNPFAGADRKGPSPLEYNPQNINLKTSKCYTIGIKLKDKSGEWYAQIPGPGNYGDGALNNKMHPNQVLTSKFKSSPACSFGKLERLSQAEMIKTPTPSPVQYGNVGETLNTLRFPRRSGYRFGSSMRQGIMEPNISPGPGTYRNFSEFSPSK